MRALIIGAGGREHALAWKIAQTTAVERVFVAPGNAGTAGEAKVTNVPINAADTAGLLAFARQASVSLTIVGPELPLVAGLADAFAAADLPCLGPSAGAARLEGSKSFCKAFLRQHDIPTADYETFTQVAPALNYLKTCHIPIVIKADGLAGGKGVIVAHSRDEAEQAVHAMLSAERFGKAGQRIVIEEFLTGEESSFIVLSDGEQAIPLASSQDHKTRDDGDTGPNTGGMGAYSPSPIIDQALQEKIMRQIIEPAIAGMRSAGHPYRGFLYAGLMIDANSNPRVLEFNCRLGDPETQPVLMRLQTDFSWLCGLALRQRLHEADVAWDQRAAVGVVMASAGYPESATRDQVIAGLDAAAAPGIKVFHAGTRTANGKTLTDGGRVLCVTALGKDVTAARHRAYQAIDHIDCEALFYRSDIAHRALRREASAKG